MTIKFPNNLYPWQKELLESITEYHSERFIVIKAFRQKAGKSTVIALLLIKASLEEIGDSIYIAPTIQQSRSQYSDILRLLNGSNLIKNDNASTLEITFINGSRILFRSAAQDDSLRGLTAEVCLVFDEAVFMSTDFIVKALPLRSVHNALTIFISTPLTMNGFFWDAFNDKNNIVLDWSKYIDLVYSPEELDQLKRIYPPNTFKTEILGQFISSGGLLFSNINECVKQAKTGLKLYVGIDLSSAVGGDYTAISVLNENKEMIDIRFNNKLEPSARIDWIADYLNSLNKVSKIFVETNNVGLVIIDQLKKKVKYPITNWTTTESSKKDIIQSLQLAFENKDIGIINNSELIKELQSFGCKIINNKIKYEGINCKDDLVLALAISLKALESHYGKYNIKIK